MSSKTHFCIEMLPAAEGDCLWVEYGTGSRVHRILIDGGPAGVFEAIERRLQQVPANKRSFELVVLTHVDSDHVEGLVRLFAERPLPFYVDRVWFNGWRQMKRSDRLLGPLQGEFLSALLSRRAPRAWSADAPPWMVPENGNLPVHILPGGMRLTILSPNKQKLRKMELLWKNTIIKSGFPPGQLDCAWNILARRKKFLPKQGLLGTARELDDLVKSQFIRDQATPNGSSIAFLAEYQDKAALFLGDAHPDLIAESLDRLCRERSIQRLRVNAIKVSHHGSSKNTSAELLRKIDCPWYLISTNGEKFRHPSKECMARLITVGKAKRLYFNYESIHTKPWFNSKRAKGKTYMAISRKTAALSLEVKL